MNAVDFASSVPSPNRKRCSSTFHANHRPALSNEPPVAFDECGVTFRWKDYRAKGHIRYKTMTLQTGEFMLRSRARKQTAGAAATRPPKMDHRVHAGRALRRAPVSIGVQE